jgi:hypothetical protein
MITEERDYGGAVRQALPLLWGLDACENDRGVPRGRVGYCYPVAKPGTGCYPGRVFFVPNPAGHPFSKASESAAARLELRIAPADSSISTRRQVRTHFRSTVPREIKMSAAVGPRRLRFEVRPSRRRLLRVRQRRIQTVGAVPTLTSLARRARRLRSSAARLQDHVPLEQRGTRGAVSITARLSRKNVRCRGAQTSYAR